MERIRRKKEGVFSRRRTFSNRRTEREGGREGDKVTVRGLAVRTTAWF